MGQLNCDSSAPFVARRLRVFQPIESAPSNSSHAAPYEPPFHISTQALNAVAQIRERAGHIGRADRDTLRALT